MALRSLSARQRGIVSLVAALTMCLMLLGAGALFCWMVLQGREVPPAISLFVGVMAQEIRYYLMGATSPPSERRSE